MDELTVVRHLRDELVVPSGGRARALAQLEAAIASKPRRPLLRRPLVLVAVVLGAVVLVGGAFALAHLIAVGDPAPADVKSMAARMGVVRGILLTPDTGQQSTPNVDALRAAAVLDASTGPVYLWVTNVRGGRGYCAYLDVTGNETPEGKPNLGGGCASANRPVQTTRTTLAVKSGQMISLISGAVQPTKVARLALTVGPRSRPIPISGRFFLTELSGQDRYRPAVVTAFAKDGQMVSRDVLPGPLTHRPHASLDVSGRTPLIEINSRYSHKPIRLFVFDQGGSHCRVLQTPGGGQGGGCNDASPRPREIAVASEQVGGASTGLLLLWGEVGAQIKSLEVRFKDGRVERLPLTDGWTLYQVARDDYAPGRQPVELVGRDNDGVAVARRVVR